MKITVLSNPNLITEKTVKGTICLVIDVLRATSSMTWAFHSGCKRLIPVTSKEAALSMKRDYPRSLLTGEIRGERIPGFHIGNSPSHYSKEKVFNKTIVMTTSNGTKAILKAWEMAPRELYISSFLNHGVTVKKVLEHLGK